MATSRTVLVTGASGLLGRDVARAFRQADWKVVGTGLSRANRKDVVKLDLLDEANIKDVLDSVKPAVIVHCAANRFPDSCSNDPAAATALNVSSTKILTQLAQAHNALLIYISTDYVFPGRKGEAPYKVTDKPSPPNVYGQTKLEGEYAVLGENKKEGKVQGVVLRVPLLYGHCDESDSSKSAVHPLVDAVWKAQEVKEGEKKVQVDDWSLRFPTSTEDVGRVLVSVSDLYLSQDDSGILAVSTGQKRAPEILQFSAEQQFTKYQIVKLFGEEILGLPITNIEPQDPTKDEVAGATQRPYDSHLDTSVLKDLGIDVGAQDFTAWWRKDLRAFRH